MLRPRAVAGLAAAACLVAACAPGEPASDLPEKKPPNVVLIVSDDAGYADFSAFGNPEMRTPEIDSIARNGVRFTAGYTAASVCSPSRAALLTGRYPQRFGHEFNIPREPQAGASIDDIGLPLSETTIADALRDLGYATIAVGKWHLGVAERFHPSRRGFDEFFGFLYGSRSYFPLETITERGMMLLRGNDPVPEAGYMTDVLAAEAAAAIERYRDRPFFMYVSFSAVHSPMHAKPEYEETFAAIEDERRRKLAAMTVSLDEGVGRILATLRDHDLDDETLVVFINDNGGATNNASANAPLRGFKGDKFEGGIRVPFMMQWPAALPQGVDYDLPVSALDIYPTVIAAARGGADGGAGLDGVDLLAYLGGSRIGRPHENLFWRRGVIAAVRDLDTKLIRVAGEPTWLFDLAADPYETRNLLSDDPETAERLLRMLDEWETGTIEPRWRTDAFWTQSQIGKHSPATALPAAGAVQEGYVPTAASAPSTDIYAASLTLEQERPVIGDITNLTDRDGYDNQPAFLPSGDAILYTSARNARQTDIYRYDFASGAIRQVTRTLASEYSATPLPAGDGFSSIHEGPGVQQLWQYGADGTSRGGILDDVQPVGYHAWGDERTLIMFVLGSGGLPATLQLGDLPSGEATVIGENPGRSLHKVPGRHAVSFVRKITDDNWWVEVLDLDTMQYTRLLPTLPGREDYAWMPDGSLLMGDGSKLYHARAGGEWAEIADLAAAGVRDISRLAINAAGTRIAIVGNRGGR